jgi:hypothetical protein
MNPLVSLIIGAIVRHGLTALAGVGLVASKDTEQFLISAAVLGLTGAWSIVQKVQHHRATSY